MIDHIDSYKKIDIFYSESSETYEDIEQQKLKKIENMHQEREIVYRRNSQ
jgi:hypothetical protein